MSDDLYLFTNKPDCPKCGGIMFSWRYVPTNIHIKGRGECPIGIGDEGEHLDLSCQNCGWTLGMMTKDADVSS